jgi:hypothetical protein
MGNQHLYRLKNFNTLVALLAGLRSESVYRLTFTRAEISRKSEKVHNSCSYCPALPPTPH